MAANPKDLLQDAASRGPGDYLEISVHDLLASWGYRVRDFDSVPHIEGELGGAGLATDPPFDQAASGAVVRLVPIGVPPAPSPQEETQETDVEEFTFPQASLLVRGIPSATAGVASVSPEDSLSLARTKMMEQGCAQVAVIASPGSLRGAVSWGSIARASVGTRDPNLFDAMEDAEQVKHDRDLLPQIPRIYDAGFMFVCDDDARVCGIITAADLSDHFETMVRPFFAIGEIERRLRRRVNEQFSADDLRRLSRNRKNPTTSADQMTLGGYVKLLEAEERWRKMDWSCDRGPFLEKLQSVCQIRNAVMHFSAKPLDDAQLLALNRFVNWLRILDPRP